MSRQLPLDLRLSTGHSLDDFYPGSNQKLVWLLRRALIEATPVSVCLHGPVGAGKTHLLQAMCRACDRSLAAAYLPMDAAGVQFGPQVTEGLEKMRLICVDDLDLVAGDSAWEDALTKLLGRSANSGSCLIYSATKALGEIDFVDRGLAFRLSMSIQRGLQPLVGDDKLWALQLRARARGIRLPERVARYLLRHYSEDLSELSRTLSTLDRASLAAKRRLTIPFVRQVLQMGPSGVRAHEP